MKFKNIIFVIILSLLTALFSAPLRAEPGKASYHPLERNVFFPVWALEQHELTPMAVSSLIVGDQTVGVVVVYDDTSTERPADYLELYDNAGQLLAVSWIGSVSKGSL